MDHIYCNYTDKHCEIRRTSTHTLTQSGSVAEKSKVCTVFSTLSPRANADSDGMASTTFFTSSEKPISNMRSAGGGGYTMQLRRVSQLHRAPRKRDCTRSPRLCRSKSNITYVKERAHGTL